jgi:hypothetical protein
MRLNAITPRHQRVTELVQGDAHEHARDQRQPLGEHAPVLRANVQQDDPREQEQHRDVDANVDACEAGDAK